MMPQSVCVIYSDLEHRPLWCATGQQTWALEPECAFIHLMLHHCFIFRCFNDHKVVFRTWLKYAGVVGCSSSISSISVPEVRTHLGPLNNVVITKIITVPKGWIHLGRTDFPNSSRTFQVPVLPTQSVYLVFNFQGTYVFTFRCSSCLHFKG